MVTCRVYKFNKTLKPFTRNGFKSIRFINSGEHYEQFSTSYDESTGAFRLYYSVWQDENTRELVYANEVAGEGFVGWKDKKYLKIAVNYLSSESADFYTWFMDNASDVTLSTLNIKYNNQIIAISDGRETIEIPCTNLEMVDNIFISVPEAPILGQPLTANGEIEMDQLLTDSEPGLAILYKGETTEKYVQNQLYLTGSSV